MKKKIYTTAPLPFMGQKRRFLRHFKEALKGYSKNATYVDLFGGSGLLSHTTKQYYPKAKVIYNDFDNYSNRINSIPQTNELLANIRTVVGKYPKEKRIVGLSRENVLKLIKQHEYKYGYVDYITISSSLLFSMKYVLNYDELLKSTLYNCVRMSDYTAIGYLEGLEIVQQDYRILFNKYCNNENVVFIIDPPYLQTTSKTYDTYWKLKDYLDVLNVLDGQRFFYFTSSKSSIIELCDWVATRTLKANPFADAEKLEIKTTLNYHSTYTDIMLFK